MPESVAARRVRAAVELYRPPNAVLAGALAIVGAYVAGGLSAHVWAAVVAGVATALGTGAGNATNDFFDREIDAVNAPDRPIPRGDVAATEALGLAAGAAAVAVAITAAFLPPLALALGVANLLVMIAYTPLFKGRYGLGNLAVAYLAGSVFLFGGLAVGSTAGVAVLAVLAGSATLAREIVKDVEDVAGDESGGLATLPVVLGTRPATILGYGFLVVTILVSPVPYVRGTFGVGYLSVVALADAVAVAAIVDGRRSVGRSQRLVKYAMAIAGLAFLVGRL